MVSVAIASVHHAAVVNLDLAQCASRSLSLCPRRNPLFIEKAIVNLSKSPKTLEYE